MIRLSGTWVRQRIRGASGLASERSRHARIARATPAPRGSPTLFYGVEHLPSPDEYANGGIVKFQRLEAFFPNDPPHFNVLYLGSSSYPRDLAKLIELAKRRDAAIVWNQDGVGYSGWHGPGWERVNTPMVAALQAADHVFFQSEFCRVGSDRYLGPPNGSAEILYNAVDTTFFTPAVSRPDRPLTLILGGSQYQRYRVETAIETLAELRRSGTEARLFVTGAITWSGDAVAGARWALGEAARLGVADAFELVGRYRQTDAPQVMRQGDILLHTKYNDPCPGVVIEAMSCGLPVVYSASGGVPELVGDRAGIGVPAPLDWEHDHPPNPGELAEAVVGVAARLEEHSAAARVRAVERFDLTPWIARHSAVFETLAR
jgi:glycosyltransferase involved in cell wall biosynthesis